MVKVQVTRDHGDAAWTLKQLMNVLYTEIQVSEASFDYNMKNGEALKPQCVIHY